MKLLIWSLSGLLLAVLTAQVLSNDSGQIVLAYSDYAVQTSLGVFVFLLIVSFTLLYVSVRLLSGMLNMPQTLRRRKQTRRQGKSEYYLTEGFLALTTGDWKAAEKLFKQGAKFSRLPVINYIAAAKAAHNLGATDRRDHYLRLASADTADSSSAVGITQAELQLQQHQNEQAYTTLKQVEQGSTGNNHTRLMMLEATTASGDWQHMLDLLGEFDNKGKPVQAILAKQKQASAEVLTVAARSGEVNDLNTAWARIPARLKQEPEVLQAYVSGRLRYPDTSECETLLRDPVRTTLEPQLVRLYGLVQGTKPEKQLALVEKLLHTHPGNSHLLLTAGRLYKRAQLWGRARHCLEESLKLQPSPEICYELATMFQGQGDSVNAGKYFREGLALATAQTSAAQQTR